MGNEIGNVAGNVAQMMLPNQKPLKCSTGCERLILIQSDLAEQGLGGCMVIGDVLLKMFGQLLVAPEVDAKERNEKLKLGREEKSYVSRLVKFTKEPGNDESELLYR